MREFKESNVQNDRIVASREDFIDAPTRWQKMGLQETASGYGKRLTSPFKVRFEGRNYRVYITIFSNNGTAWFRRKGRQIVVG